MNEYQIFSITACSVIAALNASSDETLQFQNPDGTWSNVYDNGQIVTVGKTNFETQICTPGTYRIKIQAECCNKSEGSYLINEVVTGTGGGGGDVTVNADSIALAIGDNGEVVRVDATTIPATFTLLDGTPYAGDVRLDVEYKSTNRCWKESADNSVIYSQVSCWPVDDITAIVTVWIDSNGAVLPGVPANVEPCDFDAIVEQTFPVNIRECIGNGNWRVRGWNTNSVTHDSVEPFLNIFPGTDEFGLPEILPNVDASISVSPDIDVSVNSTQFDQTIVPVINQNVQMIIEGYIITPEDLDFLVSYRDTISYTGRIYVGTSPADAVLQEEFVFGGPNANQTNGSYAPFRGATNACGQLYIRIYVADQVPGGAGSTWQIGLGLNNAIANFPGNVFERISSVNPICQTQVQWVAEGAQPVLDSYQQVGECNLEAGNLGDQIGASIAAQSAALTEPVNLITEVYRLDSDAAGVTATASLIPGDNPVIGDNVTIAAPYQSLVWRYMRETDRDDGAGAVASLDVNGHTYFPGSDEPAIDHDYIEVGYSINSTVPEQINNEVEFNANAGTGRVTVEVIVVRRQ